MTILYALLVLLVSLLVTTITYIYMLPYYIVIRLANLQPGGASGGLLPDLLQYTALVVCMEVFSISPKFQLEYCLKILDLLTSLI